MGKSFIVMSALLASAVAVVVVLQVRARTSAGAPATSQGQPAAVPVLIATAGTQDVPVILRGLGTVQAYNTAPLKSRVEGAVTQINFKEGQEVHAGEILIQLDVRPYQAALDQAKATLTKDQALLANAKTDLQRYSKLLAQNFTPEQQYATQQSTVAPTKVDAAR